MPHSGCLDSSVTWEAANIAATGELTSACYTVASLICREDYSEGARGGGGGGFFTTPSPLTSCLRLKLGFCLRCEMCTDSSCESGGVCEFLSLGRHRHQPASHSIASRGVPVLGCLCGNSRPYSPVSLVSGTCPC